MKVNLTLFYSKKVHLDLIKQQELEELDKLTTKYKSEEELRNDEEFKTKIEKFNIEHQNYRNYIENKEEASGRLCLTYYDQNGDYRKLRILYKKDSVKLSPIKVVNAIQRRLKQRKDNQLILALFREYDFIFGTEYNYRRYHLGRIKNILSFSDTPTGEDHLAKYNTLVKIVKNELIKGYDKNLKTTTSSSYYHIRLIDEFLEEKRKIMTTSRNEVTIVKENLSKIENATLVKAEEPPKKIEFFEEEYGKEQIANPDFYIPDELGNIYEEDGIRWKK